MATSGSTTWQLTRNQIIEAAMRKIQALAKGQTPDAEDYANATIALNGLTAQYQTLGMPLWKRTEYALTLVSGQSSYTIGISQSINTVFPLKMNQAILRDTSSGAQIDVQILSVYDFNLLPQNSQGTGEPVNITYQPFINYGVVKVWPTPDATTAANKTLALVYQAPVEDFINSTDTPDFPKEWHNALIYGLAVLIAPEFGIPIQDRQILSKEWKEHLDVAVDYGTEDASMFFQPNHIP